MKQISALVLLTLLSFALSNKVFSQTYSGKSNPVLIKIQPVTKADTFSNIVIAWEYPDNQTVNVNSDLATIKAGIKSNLELSEIQLFVNSQAINNSLGQSIFLNDTTKKYDKIGSQEIRLNPGNNEIKITARDKKGFEQSSTRYIQFNKVLISNDTQEPAVKRNDYALLIATDNYDEWGELTNPIFDVKTIEQELSTNYGFKTDLLLNPTKVEFLTKLRDYAKMSFQPDDQLFIFIAGNGVYDDVFHEGYTVTKDSKKNDETHESYIPHSTLQVYVNNIPCNHIFIALDVCFGGTFDQSISTAGVRGENNTGGNLTQEEFIKRKLQFKTRRYLTSGGKQYVSDNRPGAHSPFTKKFLEALRNYGGSDKILTLDELISYMQSVNPEPKYGEFGDNEPGSDFIFVAK